MSAYIMEIPEVTRPADALAVAVFVRALADVRTAVIGVPMTPGMTAVIVRFGRRLARRRYRQTIHRAAKGSADKLDREAMRVMGAGCYWTAEAPQ